MFVSVVGKVKLMTTNALALPLTCHSPAFAAAGATVVATPLMTVQKLRSRMVEIVIPVVTTTASAETELEPPCAGKRGARARSAATSTVRFTERPLARNHGPPAP